MIIGDELRRWLADTTSQDRTLDEIQAAGRRFVESAAMRRLLDELERADGAEAVMQAASRFISDFEAGESLLGELIGSVAADPFHRPPFRPVASPLHLGLLLVEDPRVTIMLGVTRADALAEKRLGRTGPASITFDGQHALYRFLKADGAVISFWESPRIEAGFTAEDSGQCRLVGRRRIVDGEIIPIDGRFQSFLIDHAASDIVYLKAGTQIGAAPVSVEYDSDSHVFVGASGADEAGARVQTMVSLLRLLDRQDAAPAIEEALKHPHFYVRWHAMREFLALDAERALPSLRRMAASDPHPDVRAAAGATLDAFFPDDASEEAEPCPA
jgi:hypothetical protein